MPKSASITRRLSGVSSTFSGFTSPWTTPVRWAAWTAPARSSTSLAASCGERPGWASRSERPIRIDPGASSSGSAQTAIST